MKVYVYQDSKGLVWEETASMCANKGETKDFFARQKCDRLAARLYMSAFKMDEFDCKRICDIMIKNGWKRICMEINNDKGE